MINNALEDYFCNKGFIWSLIFATCLQYSQWPGVCVFNVFTDCFKGKCKQMLDNIQTETFRKQRFYFLKAVPRYLVGFTV